MQWRRLLIAAVALAAVAVGLVAATGALRDTEPPRLYLEADARTPAGEPFRLFISADKPVTLNVEYGGVSLTEVTQEGTFELLAVAGLNELVIRAEAGNGTETGEALEIAGVPRLAPTLKAPGRVVAGDPLGITVRVPNGQASPLLEPAITDVLVTLAGEVIPTRQEAPGDGLHLTALAATPLSVEPATLPLEVSVIDEFGRKETLTHSVQLEPLPVEVEQLSLSASTLALITPEGRELEARVVADAWERAAHEPLYQAPFEMPIAGVNSSSFGDARRYEQGGAVSFHYGLDLAAPLGTPVHATNRGRVLAAGHYPIKGGFVMLDHGGGLMSYYMHLSKLHVKEGQLVERGEFIAEVGSEGLSTGPHLHWEMRIRQAAVNPLAFVNRVFPGD